MPVQALAAKACDSAAAKDSANDAVGTVGADFVGGGGLLPTRIKPLCLPLPLPAGALLCLPLPLPECCGGGDRAPACCPAGLGREVPQG